MLDTATKSNFLATVQEDRTEALIALINTIEQDLPKEFEGRTSGKMLSWDIPLSTYPEGYHCNPKSPLPFLSLANQKGFIALYHMGLYADSELHDWFVAEYPNHSKYKLDMGKSCIRFKKVNDIPFKLIGELLQKMSAQNWINLYEKNIRK